MEFNQPFGIHWYRRDLRVFGNEALEINREINNGRVLGLFCFDSTFLSRADFSNNRFSFFLKTLESLRSDLRSRGGDLLVVNEVPQIAFPKILHFFKEKVKKSPTLFTFNRDYEPFSRNRDEEVDRLMKENGVEVKTSRDHLIIEPHEILKPDGDFYKVYTPYFKKWFSHLETKSIQNRIHFHKFLSPTLNSSVRVSVENSFHLNWNNVLQHEAFPYEDSLLIFKEKNEKNVTIRIPEAGSQVAQKEIYAFKDEVENYLSNRDFPAIRGTSRLSHFLKNGSITTAQVLKILDLKINLGAEKSSTLQYLKEIVWREFYYSILFHRPDVEKGCFLKQYDSLKWENSDEKLSAWKEGRTGFPIVDAGMRELSTTGFMHNRVRMIVASFLTKDLLIDWRFGENHFMKYLLDGDLAPNNGGWQWAASTGCDPQPYFRVFNPWLQSEKFDPDGTYIKKYIPELKEAPAKALHQEESDRSRWKYPKPIVCHAIQRDKAIKLFKK